MLWTLGTDKVNNLIKVTPQKPQTNIILRGEAFKMLSCNPKMWQAHAPAQLVRHGQPRQWGLRHITEEGLQKRFFSATSPSAKIPPIADHLKMSPEKKKSEYFLTVHQANVNISEEEERKEGGKKRKEKNLDYIQWARSEAGSCFSIFALFLSPRASGRAADKALGFHERKWKQKPWMRSFRGDTLSIKH